MSKKSLARRTWSRFRRPIRRFALRSIGLIGPPLLGLLARTWRIRIVDRPHLDAAAAGRGCLLALWHGRMVLPMATHDKDGYSILVSHSKDGELMHRLLRRFGYGTIRGSTSRGAPRALREMLRDLAAGGVVVVTPDGPRGPIHRMNAGLAWMSRATGFPVVSLGLATNRGWVLPSWDRFIIPKPFARVAIVYSPPRMCERAADEARMDAFTNEVRDDLLEQARRASELVGGDVTERAEQEPAA